MKYEREKCVSREFRHGSKEERIRERSRGREREKEGEDNHHTHVYMQTDGQIDRWTHTHAGTHKHTCKQNIPLGTVTRVREKTSSCGGM